MQYSAEQIASWARSDEGDVNRWNSARKSLSFYVATIGAEVAAVLLASILPILLVAVGGLLSSFALVLGAGLLP